MLVKLIWVKTHKDHLLQSFEVLDKYKKKLNLEKCTFYASFGQFLGYLVTLRRIEANPNQIQAFLNVSLPKIKKEAQKLARKMVTLINFISLLLDESMGFFKVLKKNKSVTWTSECENMFQQLKCYMSMPRYYLNTSMVTSCTFIWQFQIMLLVQFQSEMKKEFKGSYII